MAQHRQSQINIQVRNELSNILRNVKDPRISASFVSITDAEVSADLSFAKIFFSVMNGDPAEVLKGLESANGYIRGELASRLNLRITPKLTFINDDSVNRAIRISDILKNNSQD